MENCETWQGKEPTEIISSKIIEEINEFHERHDIVFDCENCVYTCGFGKTVEREKGGESNEL